MNQEETLSSAIEEFNKIRSPEITAKLVNFDGKSFIIEFTGPFCYTCAFYDFLDDFKYLLEDDYGLKTNYIEVDRLNEGALVSFQIK